MEVKQLVQETDDDCGPTCVAMITKQSITDVKSELKIYDRGTYMVQLAAYLRHMGFFCDLSLL